MCKRSASKPILFFKRSAISCAASRAKATNKICSGFAKWLCNK
ncbi:Uncharacterised protein [Vibrio cholerae]|nr:Uncharacterised protein [Vibrio cholerae]CSB93262.1 Uncharacterised protein [Vibrio cholerae]CSD25861.1 Uncharacterised protein [Vibrio cholerae]